MIAVGLAIGLEALPGCATLPRESPAPGPGAEYGVEFVSLRRSGAGHLLDLRYRVIAPEQAARLVGKGEQPHLLDLETGLRAPIPVTAKTGLLRSSGPLQAGRIYFILFANPGGRIGSGAQVALVLGESRIDGLVVE